MTRGWLEKVRRSSVRLGSAMQACYSPAHGSLLVRDSTESRKPVRSRRGPRHCSRGRRQSEPLGEHPGKGLPEDDAEARRPPESRAR